MYRMLKALLNLFYHHSSELYSTAKAKQKSQNHSGLLPNEIDRIAETEPQATFLSVPIDKGYRAITFRQYANAINGTAYWLEKHLGKGDQSQSLAWFGAGGSDIRYAILLVAAVKAGYYVRLMLVTAKSQPGCLCS